MEKDLVFSLQTVLLPVTNTEFVCEFADVVHELEGYIAAKARMMFLEDQKRIEQLILNQGDVS